MKQIYSLIKKGKLRLKRLHNHTFSASCHPLPLSFFSSPYITFLHSLLCVSFISPEFHIKDSYGNNQTLQRTKFLSESFLSAIVLVPSLCAILCMSHSTRLEYRWDASACVRACLHWRPLHVPFHSSFQQGTMGKWELLHHPAVMACFAAESWPASVRVFNSLPLRAHTHTHLSSTHFLFHTVVYKACCSQTALHHWCISNTVPVRFPPPALFFCGMKEVTGGALTHTCITSSYLGQ